MSERSIFKYFDGEKEVYGDPLRMMRDLYVALGDPDDAFKASEEGDARALNTIMDNARTAFRMTTFDPATNKGAKDEDVEEVIDRLWEYLEKKNQASAGLPSSSPSTISTPTAFPTKPSSD